MYILHEFNFIETRWVHAYQFITILVKKAQEQYIYTYIIYIKKFNLQFLLFMYSSGFYLLKKSLFWTDSILP